MGPDVAVRLEAKVMGEGRKEGECRVECDDATRRGII